MVKEAAGDWRRRRQEIGEEDGRRLEKKAAGDWRRRRQEIGEGGGRRLEKKAVAEAEEEVEVMAELAGEGANGGVGSTETDEEAEAVTV